MRNFVKTLEGEARGRNQGSQYYNEKTLSDEVNPTFICLMWDICNTWLSEWWSQKPNTVTERTSWWHIISLNYFKRVDLHLKQVELSLNRQFLHLSPPHGAGGDGEFLLCGDYGFGEKADFLPKGFSLAEMWTFRCCSARSDICT